MHEWRDNRFDVLDELIAAGWGDVPQPDIPANWRELKPPGHVLIQERRDVA